MIRLSLCKDSCCPTVELEYGQVKINDDYGGKVVLTLEQLKILLDKFSELE